MNDLIFFRQATARICSSLDPQIVLRRCFDFLKEYMPIHGISMMVYDTEIEALRIIAYALDPMRRQGSTCSCSKDGFAPKTSSFVPFYCLAF